MWGIFIFLRGYFTSCAPDLLQFEFIQRVLLTTFPICCCSPTVVLDFINSDPFHFVLRSDLSNQIISFRPRTVTASICPISIFKIERPWQDISLGVPQVRWTSHSISALICMVRQRKLRPPGSASPAPPNLPTSIKHWARAGPVGLITLFPSHLPIDNTHPWPLTWHSLRVTEGWVRLPGPGLVKTPIWLLTERVVSPVS